MDLDNTPTFPGDALIVISYTMNELHLWDVNTEAVLATRDVTAEMTDEDYGRLMKEMVDEAIERTHA